MPARKAAAPVVENDITSYLAQAPGAKFPRHVAPMLAKLSDKPFDDPDWIYEIKWDGYRSMALMNGKEVELKSRNDKSFNEKFYPIYEAVKKWGIRAVVDGEIVVIDEKGMPGFGALQNWRSEADGTLIYYVFDILWLDGRDLTELPLVERRAILKSLIPRDSLIRLSEDFSASGSNLFDAIKKMGLEGLMAKRKGSTYQQSGRTGDWMKIKGNKRQEMVIGGYTNNDGSNKPFSSLLVGVYEGKKLVYTGKVGTGFNVAAQKEMMKQFKPLVTDRMPFSLEPEINKPSRFNPNPPRAKAVWLQPKLVCEVSFTEITGDGVMRHPSFEGMRIDKNASAVVMERPEAPVPDALTKKMVKPAAKGSRKTLLNPTDETQVREVNGHELKFTNLSKLYWPEDGVTKRDMINYYYQVAPFILPYLRDRPQSLNRFPNGIHGESFYQKDVTGKAPDWIETFLYHSNADERDKHFMVGTDEASLLYMASLGCIELNPWSSRVSAPDNPDFCIIDLDPDKNTFEQVIEAAQVTRSILDSMGVPCYPKTSGSTGIHIYIPLGAKYSYEQSKEYAGVVAKLVHKELPRYTSIERKTADRGGKMYIDFLQNRPQATIAAPYSLRPKPGATVSTPLHWEEVRKGLKMKDFTIRNVLDRFKAEGDLFKPVLGKGIDMLKALKKLE